MQPGHPVSDGRGPVGERSFRVPMIALAAALVVLVVAILVLLGSRLADRAGPGPTAAASGAGCLVGNWRATTHTEQVEVPDLGRLTFTGGQGTRLSLDDAGGGLTDYGSGTAFRSGYRGQEIVLELRGTVSYRYTVDGARVELHEVRSDAEFRLRIGSRPAGDWRDFVASTEPSSFTCTPHSLTQESLVSATSYARVT